MQTKLRIDLSQGVVDVEGDSELVREIYTDFKDKILNDMGYSQSPVPEATTQAKPETDSQPKRRRTARKRATTDKSGSSINADRPKMDKNLDTSRLPEFYNQFDPKNNQEKILIFLKFLIDNLRIESPNTDQVYTCYEAMNERVPKAFAQAFHDASGRRFGYIDYNSSIEIAITTVGNNHFKFDLKKKGDE